MKHKPINPDLLIDYNDYFVENNANLDILDDFFYHLTMLIDKDENVDLSKNIADIIQDIDFDSLDETKIFIKKYTEYKNSVTGFIEFLEKNANNDKIDEFISELFYTFLVLYDDDIDKITPIIVANATEILKVIFDKYNISLAENDDELKQFESDINNILGENFSFLIISILTLVEKIDTEPEDRNKKVPLLFTFLVVFVMNMNLLRKSEFKKKNSLRESRKKTGRNDPCPCGSGLKFKKCCLLKI
jgi:hypothetical protein